MDLKLADPPGSSTQLDIVRLQPALGAEVRGVDLSLELSEPVKAGLRNALCRHKVLVFRNQSVDRERHIAFCRIFGDIVIHPLHPFPDYPEIMEVKSDGTTAGGADAWHTDNSYKADPPASTVLRACTVPSLGGDTAFASAVAAYEGLSDEVKALIEGRRAIHDVRMGFRHYPKSHADKLAPIAEQYPPMAHPIVRLIPETGERALYVNEGYTSYIEGMDEGESRVLLRQLFDQFRRPEYQFRLAWAPGSMTIWDNRSAVHYAVTDYSEPRRLERSTINGSSPMAA